MAYFRKWTVKKDFGENIFKEFQGTLPKTCRAVEGVAEIMNRLGEAGISLADVPHEIKAYDIIGEELLRLKEKYPDFEDCYRRTACIRAFVDFMKWPIHAGLLKRTERFTGRFGGVYAQFMAKPIQYLLFAVDKNESLNTEKNRNIIYWFWKIGPFIARGSKGREKARANIHNFLGSFEADFNFEEKPETEENMDARLKNKGLLDEIGLEERKDPPRFSDIVSAENLNYLEEKERDINYMVKTPIRWGISEFVRILREADEKSPKIGRAIRAEFSAWLEYEIDKDMGL